MYIYVSLCVCVCAAENKAQSHRCNTARDVHFPQKAKCARITTCISIFCIPLATGKYDNIGFPRVVKTLTGKMIAAGGQQKFRNCGRV